MLKNLYNYENTIPLRKRIDLGIVYTPQHIVAFINKTVLELWDKPTPPRFIDPCCGTGAFLVDMAKRVSNRYSIPIEEVYKKYTFGQDVDADAIALAAGLLPDANLNVCDSLMTDYSEYDLIVTNPPYIRIQNLEVSLREKLKKNFSFCKGDTDIYMAFLEKIAKSNRISGLIFPNSWIKNKSGDTAREHLRNTKRTSMLIDFQSKKVFHNASTYTNILVLDSKETETIQVGTTIDNLRHAPISKVFLSSGAVVVDHEEQKFVESVSKRDTSLLDIADIKTGLATLSDDIFCVEVVRDLGEMKEVKKRGKKHSDVFELESSCLKPCIRAGDITKNTDKEYAMVYPYYGTKPIGEQNLKHKYPKTYQYLLNNVHKLNKRDKGKDKGYTWVEFGRTQALGLLDRNKIVFSTVIKDEMVLKDCPAGNTFVSGYCFIQKDMGLSAPEIKKILVSDDLLRWVRIFGKSLGSGWLGVSKQTLKNYRINLAINTDVREKQNDIS